MTATRAAAHLAAGLVLGDVVVHAYNLAKGDALCRRARAMGADLALFPEMWNIGYTPYPGCTQGVGLMGAESPEQQRARAQWQAQAVGPDDPFVLHFRRLARGLEMAIALTYLERWPGARRGIRSR